VKASGSTWRRDISKKGKEYLKGRTSKKGYDQSQTEMGLRLATHKLACGRTWGWTGDRTGVFSEEEKSP